MKKINESKLSFKKETIAEITNLKSIVGGIDGNDPGATVDLTIFKTKSTGDC